MLQNQSLAASVTVRARVTLQALTMSRWTSVVTTANEHVQESRTQTQGAVMVNVWVKGTKVAA